MSIRLTPNLTHSFNGFPHNVGFSTPRSGLNDTCQTNDVTERGSTVEVYTIRKPPPWSVGPPTVNLKSLFETFRVTIVIRGETHGRRRVYMYASILVLSLLS